MRRFEGSEYVDADHIDEVSYWWPPKHEAYKATKPTHTPTLARRQFVQQAAGRYWWPLNSFMGLDSDLRYKSRLLPLSLCQPHTHTHHTVSELNTSAAVAATASIRGAHRRGYPRPLKTRGDRSSCGPPRSLITYAQLILS
jgi:hypothetical protein